MSKIVNVFLLGLLMSMLLAGCGDDAVKEKATQETSPLEVRLETHNFSNHYGSGSNELVNIIAIEDSVTIEAIMLNRGNLKVGENALKQLPHTLKYGEIFRVYSHPNLKEVQVLTRDKGAWVFTF